MAPEVPEPAEIIARARAMIPTLAKRSFEGRRQRRIPDETIADLQAALLAQRLEEHPARQPDFHLRHAAAQVNIRRRCAFHVLSLRQKRHARL